MITSIRDSIAAWLRGEGDHRDWSMCSNCNGSGYIVQAWHIEEGYTEYAGQYNWEPWEKFEEDDFYYHKEKHLCDVCWGSGAYHYEDGRLIPGKGNRQSRIDYHAYIGSQEWRNKATAAKERAGWRCQVCNRKRGEVTLDAHHRTYERLGNERPDDITVLCRDCHELYEKNKKARRNGGNR